MMMKNRLWLVLACGHALATLAVWVSSFYFLLQPFTSGDEVPLTLSVLEALGAVLSFPLLYFLWVSGAVQPWGAGFPIFLVAAAMNSLLVVCIGQYVSGKMKFRVNTWRVR
jgi:hypothetical protein